MEGTEQTAGKSEQDSQPNQKAGEKRKCFRSIPVISSEDQKSILEEIKTVFDEKFGDWHLVQIMNSIKRNNPDLESSQYEEKLREACTEVRNEKYKDRDPAELIALLNDESKIQGLYGLREFAKFGIGNRTLKEMRKLGRENKLHLILSDGRENVIQNGLSNEALLGVPVCKFSGVSKLLNEILHFRPWNKLDFFAFVKCEESPFNDLIKFIIEKIPPVVEDAHGKKLKLSLEEEEETAESNGEQEEEGPQPGSQRKFKRFRGIPVISSEDQHSILQEIKTVFEKKVGVHYTKNDKLKRKGLNRLKRFAIYTRKGIIKLGQRNPEKLILILADGREKVLRRVLSNKYVRGIPVCSYEGLCTLLKKFVPVSDLEFLAFFKCEESPFNDLVKFIIEKIPPEELSSEEEEEKTAESNGEEEEKVTETKEGKQD